MKTYQINHASWIQGPFGAFGSLLANPLGHREEQEVSKITIRINDEETYKAISEWLKALKDTDEVLTATAEYAPVHLSNGDIGFTVDRWEDKVTREKREQASLYISFATEPQWDIAKKTKVNTIGNLKALRRP